MAVADEAAAAAEEPVRVREARAADGIEGHVDTVRAQRSHAGVQVIAEAIDGVWSRVSLRRVVGIVLGRTAMADEPESKPEDPQVEILRRMTPEQKLRAAERLYWSARELKAAWFRSEHPEWTEEQVKKAVRDAFLFHHE